MKNYKEFSFNLFNFLFIVCVLFLCMNLFSEDTISVEEIRELEELKLGEVLTNEGEEKFLEIQTSVKRDTSEDCVNCIYGYKFFNSTPTTFALSSNIPIPQDYVVGPGDKLKIEYYGNNKNEAEIYISRSGSFKLPLLGPINIAGLKLSKAEELIRKKVTEELVGTEVFISLSELRSINLYVVGAAYKPGTYTVSSLASMTNVIFATAGPNEVGSLRNIELKRNGKVIGTYDFYKLLLEGDTSQDMRLQEGDTIYYPLIKNTVRIDGAVLRPGRYEILLDDNLDNLFKFTGLEGKSDLRIEFSRFDENKKVRNIKTYDRLENVNELILKDGDSVNLLSSSKQVISNVFLTGEVNYPGYYAISAGETISEVLNRAGGFSDLAYPEGAVFTRESVRLQQKDSYFKTAENLERSLIDAITGGNQIDGEAYLAISNFINQLKEQEPIGRQVANIDEYSLESDPRLDFVMQDGDTLYIPKRSSSISVVGEVLNSTTHLYKEDISIQGYIEQSGGTTDGADLSKIFIILPNGQSLAYKRKLFQSDLSNELLPGSTIVVSRNPDPYNWLKLTSIITPILSDLAVSAAAIAALED